MKRVGGWAGGAQVFAKRVKDEYSGGKDVEMEVGVDGWWMLGGLG